MIFCHISNIFEYYDIEKIFAIIIRNIFPKLRFIKYVRFEIFSEIIISKNTSLGSQLYHNSQNTPNSDHF